MKNPTLAIAIISLAMVGCNKTPKLNPDNIDDVAAAMTLEEKVHLVVGTGMIGTPCDAASG